MQSCPHCHHCVERGTLPQDAAPCNGSCVASGERGRIRYVRVACPRYRWCAVQSPRAVLIDGTLVVSVLAGLAAPRERTSHVAQDPKSHALRLLADWRAVVRQGPTQAARPARERSISDGGGFGTAHRAGGLSVTDAGSTPRRRGCCARLRRDRSPDTFEPPGETASDCRADRNVGDGGPRVSSRRPHELRPDGDRPKRMATHRGDARTVRRSTSSRCGGAGPRTGPGQV